MTLIRIYDELRALGYDGSYDAIRRYPKGWSKDRGAVTAEAYVPLYYAPGAAYLFDWSHETVLIPSVKTAVEAVFIGKERLYNRRFLQICSHYLLHPVAGTPASGWEKWQAENQVGPVRMRSFTPRLRVKSPGH